MPATPATSPQSGRQHFSVHSTAEPWLTLHLHAVLPHGTAPRAVLLLHGATLSGFIFDVPVAGASIQERLAANGWATYALDARGFGLSTRPHPGERGCPVDLPFGGAVAGIDDVADAVRYLREVRGHSEVALLGFSWGTVCAGCVAAERGGIIDRMILCAPIHASHNPEWLQRLGDPADLSRLNPAFGAYRWTSAEGLQARWDGDIPVADKSAWRERDVLHAVLEGALAGDPLSSTRTPRAFRAPNGSIADLFAAFNRRPVFDAAKIRVPTLLLRGEGDTTASDADARLLLRSLGCSHKEYRIIAGGSHFQCLERSMPAMLDACLEFLG